MVLFINTVCLNVQIYSFILFCAFKLTLTMIFNNWRIKKLSLIWLRTEYLHGKHVTSYNS